MEVNFDDDDLEALCMDESIAKRRLGKPCAKKLRARLADLWAATHVKELLAGRPHALKGNRYGQYAIRLSGAKRIVFRPANNPVPETDDGGIDWARVTEVCVVFIGDYHD